MKYKKSNKNRDNTIIRIVKISSILASLLIFSLYIILSVYYNTHFFKNTKVNGVSISDMNIKEAQKKVSSFVDDYIITIEGRGGIVDKISGDSIDLKVKMDDALSKAIKKQNGFLWLLNIKGSINVEVKTSLVYNESKLLKRLEALKVLDEENMIPSIDAHISDYTDNGYVIIPETKGTKLYKDRLLEEVKNAIGGFKKKLILEDSNVYIEADVLSNDPSLKKRVANLNKYIVSKITYEFGDKIEVVDGHVISKWLVVDKYDEVSIDKSKVREYVDYIGKTYNTFGKTRTIMSSYGVEVKVSGGDYGWWLNRVKEVDELAALVEAGAVTKKTPAYYQTANYYGEDDIGDTYVELNLTAQHLFFYKDGELIVQSDFVSGNISKGWGTPTGTYPIQYKQREATLTGEDYSTPVDYWMPFNGNIGFHDAPWRKSFGSDVYLRNGSHGCINLPPAVAKVLYENIGRGVAVYVYELPGTENYRVDSIDSENTLINE